MTGIEELLSSIGDTEELLASIGDRDSTLSRHALNRESG